MYYLTKYNYSQSLIHVNIITYLHYIYNQSGITNNISADNKIPDTKHEQPTDNINIDSNTN